MVFDKFGVLRENEPIRTLMKGIRNNVVAQFDKKWVKIWSILEREVGLTVGFQIDNF